MKHYIEMKIDKVGALENHKINAIKSIRCYTGFELRLAKQAMEELNSKMFIRIELDGPRTLEYMTQGAALARQAGISVDVKSENYLKDIKYLITDALSANDFEEVKRLCDVAMSFDTL